MSSVRISVYVQPRASKTEVAGMHGDAWKIRVAAPPVDNAANAELIEFIALKLDIAKTYSGSRRPSTTDLVGRAPALGKHQDNQQHMSV